jgi:GDP/UDP-N,N'-diacetylbacillosamine 2-epimerase (hydrolysing)
MLKYKVDFNIPTILVTFHPETTNYYKTEYHVKQITKALTLLKNYQIIITLPNIDTKSTLIKKYFINLNKIAPNKIKLFENLGTQDYLSFMRLSKFLLGNTSSGIIEASSLNKYVINLGTRQEGRVKGENILQCEINTHKIIQSVKEVEKLPLRKFNNPYYNGGASKKIMDILKYKI